jgi:hypothetical protein
MTSSDWRQPARDGPVTEKSRTRGGPRVVTGDEAAERRRAAAEQADYHEQALRRRREQESTEAQVLIDRFVASATAAGLPTEELVARPWSGRARYRTGVVGWHLRRDQSIGLSVDGAFYSLVVPPQRFGRRTIDLEPTPPPLQPGLGAGDGESASLDALLELRLLW